MPLECFHGNGYSESVEVVRSEDGKIKGLQLKFLMEGKYHIDMYVHNEHILCREWSYGFSCFMSLSAHTFYVAFSEYLL